MRGRPRVDLQDERKLAWFLISHDLATLEHLTWGAARQRLERPDGSRRRLLHPIEGCFAVDHHIEPSWTHAISVSAVPSGISFIFSFGARLRAVRLEKGADQ